MHPYREYKNEKPNADESSLNADIPPLAFPTSNTHKRSKNTVLVAGDSIISGGDERRMLDKFITKARVFLGPSVDGMFDYIKPLLKKFLMQLWFTLAPTNEMSYAMLDKIFKFKIIILKTLPESKGIISSVVNRSDNAKAYLTVRHLNNHLTVRHLNNHLKSLALEMIDNSNIDEKCLGEKGLRINERASGRLAMNLVRKIKSFCKN